MRAANVKRQSDAATGGRYAWVILGVGVFVTMTAIGFARLGYTMVLPSMQADLGLSEVQAADLATGNLFGYLLLAVFGGYLASRFGSRMIITASLLLISVSMLLTGFARGYPAALLTRIFAGLGSGGANVPVMGMLSAWFVSRRRGLASGVAVGGTSLALLVSGWLVPWILRRGGPDGWREVWFIPAAAAFLVVLLALLLLRNSPSNRPLLHAGGEEVIRAKATSCGPEAGGTGGRGTASGNWSAVYRSAMVWKLGLVYAAFGFSYIVYTTFFARYLTGEMGLTSSEAGRIWSGIGAVSLISGFVWGTISDRIGRRFGLALVFLIQGAAYLVFGYWRAPAGYLLSASLFALTAWSIPAIMSAAAGDVVGSRLAPAGLGFITFFFGIAQASGPFAAGRIAQGFGSYSPAFALAGGVALLGVLLSLSLRRFRRTLDGRAAVGHSRKRGSFFGR